jgi:anti-sigma factor RsiW
MSGHTDDAAPGTAIRCQEVVELLTDYLEGELDDDTRAELEAHLGLCPGCDAYFAQMRRTIAELGHVPVETLSPQAQDELLAAFRTVHPRRPGQD